jgi:ribonuclease-3
VQFLNRVLEKFKQRKFKSASKQIEEFFTPTRLTQLEKITGYPVKNKSIYVQAFIHRSFLEENNHLETSNERLEFLGDSVLNLVIGEFLFNEFPDEEEGFLTKVRAKMVNKNALIFAAESVNLGDFVLLGKNLSRSIINNSKSILADTLEAIIGAIYLDSGMDATSRFINRIIIKPILDEGEHLVDENYKSQLLEYVQAEKLENPNYEVLNIDGPQHDRIFTIDVSIGNQQYGTGTGKTKKTAEQMAAKHALQKIDKLK